MDTEKIIENEVPNSVAILGLGPSLESFVKISKALGSRQAVADEVWGINTTGSIFDCALTFHMDDVRVQEVRAEANPESPINNLIKWLKVYKGRVLTSVPHPDYPCLEAYPLADVLNAHDIHYFNSTISYALAYALHIGVKNIKLFGCDFTYPGLEKAEKGRACLEYWMGYAHAKGVKIGLPHNTSLMDQVNGNKDRFYGYDCVNILVRRNEEGKLELQFEEKGETPSAEEIEQRYDTTRHPNALMGEK